MVSAACGSEHQIGVEVPDGGAAGGGDAGLAGASQLKNLVVTLVEQTRSATGQVDDRYTVSFILYNGDAVSMLTVDRIVIRAGGQDLSYTQLPECMGSAHAAILPGTSTPIIRFDLTYRSGGAGEAVIATSCGMVSKASAANLAIPSSFTLEIHGLHADGAPYDLSASTTTVDGR